jgi:UDP-N-acetylglucosamine 2-epimerase (non-hydrolysing)
VRIKVISVVGARPNYMKIAPLMKEMKKYPKCFHSVLVHTGQHYDKEMSRLFFDDLKMPKPDINLKVGSGSHAEQTADVIVRFEKVLLKERPDLVVVAGDINSTIGCALTAKKLHIKVAHIESGLRSFDMRMPEEINRKLTDTISDYLFTPSPDANKNLKKEGIPGKKIFFVGNIMIDSLLGLKKLAQKSRLMEKYGLKKKGFALLTMHRPENVDNKTTLRSALRTLAKISKEKPIIFPLHPRTAARIKAFGLDRYVKPLSKRGPGKEGGIFIIPPIGYLDFINLMINCRFVLTDSGGIQEEATILKIPCITLRDNTERPITVEYGVNFIVGMHEKKILRSVNAIMKKSDWKFRVPKYWDGKTARRIIDALKGRQSL